MNKYGAIAIMWLSVAVVSISSVEAAGWVAFLAMCGTIAIAGES